MSSTTFTSPPVPLRPAPWELRCEQYWIQTWLPAGSLPKGCYGRFEWTAETRPSTVGEFKGGLVNMMVVRYSDTPCGPYDELQILPGMFATPGGKPDARRVTACYVSSEHTAFNGRYNWTVPKHLARFEFSSPPVSASSPRPPSLSVAVFPPDPASSTPFFSATLRPWRVLPGLPFASNYMPIAMILAQPPLPTLAPDKVPTSGFDEVKSSEILIATDEWVKADVPIKKSKMQAMWVEVHHSKAGSNEAAEAEKWWPSIVPWSVGFWLENAEMTISTLETWTT